MAADEPRDRTRLMTPGDAVFVRTSGSSPTRQLMGSAPIPFALSAGPAVPPPVAHRRRKSVSIVSQLRLMVEALSAAEEQLLGPVTGPPTAILTPARPRASSKGRPRDPNAVLGRMQRVDVRPHTALDPCAKTTPGDHRRRVSDPMRKPRPSAPLPVTTQFAVCTPETLERPTMPMGRGSPRLASIARPIVRTLMPAAPTDPDPPVATTPGALTVRKPADTPRQAVGVHRHRRALAAAGPSSVSTFVKRKGSIADRSCDNTFLCLGAPDQSSEIRRALLHRGWTDIRCVC